MRDDIRRRDPGRLRQAVLLTAAMACTVLVTACGGSSGAHITSAGGSAAGSSAASSGLAYSQCMRSHGLKNFPDPTSSGGINITAGSGIDPSSPQYAKAQQACQSLMPGAGTTAQQEQNYTADLKYAKCMQAHGVLIPDPKAPGTGPETQGNSNHGSGTSGTNGVNPDSPQFISASKACQGLLPAGNAPGTSSSGGGS